MRYRVIGYWSVPVGYMYAYMYLDNIYHNKIPYRSCHFSTAQSHRGNCVTFEGHFSHETQFRHRIEEDSRQTQTQRIHPFAQRAQIHRLF